MNVRDVHASCIPDKTSDCDVFSYDEDHLLQHLPDILALAIVARQQSVQVCRCVFCDSRSYMLDKVYKLLVLRHKIRFSIDLDNDADIIDYGGICYPFGGNAPGFLLCGCQAFFAEPVNCLHVSVGRDKRSCSPSCRRLSFRGDP